LIFYNLYTLEESFKVFRYIENDIDTLRYPESESSALYRLYVVLCLN